MQQDRVSSERLVPATLLLTSLLTLLTIVVCALPVKNKSLLHLHSDWAVWLAILQISGMSLLLFRCGRPVGRGPIAALLLGNLWLLLLNGMYLSGELPRQLVIAADAGVRLLLASAWVGIACGTVAAGLWIVRHRRNGAAAPVWIRYWFAAALLMGTLELGLRMLESGNSETATAAQLPLEPQWSPGAPDRLSIVGIGGSTMLGVPYNPWISIPVVVAETVQDSLPAFTCETANLADNGRNFAESALRLNSLSTRPDLILLYTGHNEFFRDLEATVRTPDSTLPMLDRAFAWSTAYQTLCALPLQLRGPGKQLYLEVGQILREPLFSEPVLSRRLEQFRRQLRRFAQFCQDERIFTVWFVPACSEGVYEPDRSLDNRPLDAARERRLQQVFARARTLEADGRWDLAAEVYRQLIDEFPATAEVYFRHGASLAALGEYAQAQECFLRATDLDAQPARANSSYRQAVREIARQYDIPTIDAAQALRPLTPHGLLDRSVIHDNVHPVLQGYVALGQAVVQLPQVQAWLSARRESIFGSTDASATAPPLASLEMTLAEPTFEELMQRRGIDADRLATACERTAWCLEHLSQLRTDSSRRRNDAAQYRWWASQLRSGAIQPGEAGSEFLTTGSRPGVLFPAAPPAAGAAAE